MSSENKFETEYLLGAKVIYVDENSINRTLASLLLKGAGAVCTAVSTLGEMVDALGRTSQDLLILDLDTVASAMEAFEIARREPRFRELPLIAVGREKSGADSIGAHYFVSAPLDPVHLLTVLAEARLGARHAAGDISRTALLSRVGAKPEAAAELLAQFIHDYAGHVALIELSEQRGEREKVSFLLRNLRAASSAIGADSLYHIAGEIQDEYERREPVRLRELKSKLRSTVKAASELRGEFAGNISLNQPQKIKPRPKARGEHIRTETPAGEKTEKDSPPLGSRSDSTPGQVQEQGFGETFILAVDDSKANLQFLSACLSDDYRVHTASSGPEALLVAKGSPAPAIILLDVTMPGMDGYETCRFLKEDPRTRSIPVIFITSLSKEEDERRGLALGAVDYIRKPFSVPILKARLNGQLELLRAREYLETLVEKRTQALRETQREVVFRLALAAEYRDNDTGSHIKRISYYSMTLSEALGFPRQEADNLFYASSMHDVGKIGIPDSILLKPGKLTDQEWEIMKTHTTIGAGLLEGHPSDLLSGASRIALTHHEKWNGKGYPAGLQGEAIPMEGRIVAVCDVFDALLSKRPYKRKWTADEALDEINRLSGSHFDPAIVHAFNDNYPEFLKIMDRFND